MQQMNRIAITPLYDAALHHLNRWVGGGEPPPSNRSSSSPAIRPQLVRDEHGIAVGGVRLPQADVPVAQNSAIPLGQDIYSMLWGSSHPFDAAEARSVVRRRGDLRRPVPGGRRALRRRGRAPAPGRHPARRGGATRVPPGTRRWHHEDRAHRRRRQCGRLIRQAERAEAEGFSSLWYPGQVLGDALAAITLAGRATSTIELGTAIVPTYLFTAFSRRAGRRRWRWPSGDRRVSRSVSARRTHRSSRRSACRTPRRAGTQRSTSRSSRNCCVVRR